MVCLVWHLDVGGWRDEQRPVPPHEGRGCLLPKEAQRGGGGMNLTDGNKAFIDSHPYDELLRKWRFAPAGDPWFQGETGDYWKKRMAELRAQGADHVGASKRLGWGK